MITGGAGFIGSHLTEELVKRGRSVVVVDDLSNGRMDNLKAVEPQLNFHRNDITRGLLELDGLEKLDEIYHLAC